MKPKLIYSKIMIIAICILIIGIPFQTAYADMGPKPTAEFDFIYETSEPLEIVEAALMECETSACLQPLALEEMGRSILLVNKGGAPQCRMDTRIIFIWRSLSQMGLPAKVMYSAKSILMHFMRSPCDRMIWLWWKQGDK